MASLNKTQLESLATTLARTEPAVTALTQDEIDALDWNSMRKHASELAKLHLADERVQRSRYAHLFEGAFVNAATNVWYSKTKQRDNARRSWQRALEGITLDEAKRRVAELVTGRVHGARVDDSYSGVHVRCERAFALSADLYIKFERDDETTNPDDPTQKAWRYHVQCELSWGSTGRSVSEALAAVNLYRELTDLAAEVEVVMNDSRHRSVGTYGVPEPAPAVEQPTEGQR